MICTLYHQAQERHERGIHLVSTDEKTGIQALERNHPDQPAAPGRLEPREFAYQRHGTPALIANFEVATGQRVRPIVGDTRTEEDCVAHLRATVAADPGAEWVFIVDPLNTHQSSGLVRLAAERCGIPDDLGRKGDSGILRDRASRKAFLEDGTHKSGSASSPAACSSAPASPPPRN